jgi:hypothetical protein
MFHKLRLGAILIIIIRIRNGAKTISCALKGWFFQNGCRCHGNGQNAKIKEKIIIADYSPNRNWWNLIGTTSPSSGTR